MGRNKKTEQASISKVVKIYYIILFALSFIFIAQFIVLGVIYLNSKEDGVRIALFSTSLALLIIIVFYVIFVVFRYTNMFFGGLYQNTLDNYKRIADEERELSDYKNRGNYFEFSQLNKNVDEINKLYKKIIINNGKLDYKSFGLAFVDNYANAVTYDSFEKNYKKVLEASCNFRHILISYQYPRSVKKLTSSEFALFYMTTRQVYDYDNLLVINNEKYNEYLIYIPRFDSLSNLMETIEKSFEKYCVNRSTATGFEMINSKIAAVVYPYSHMDDFLTDLKYAKHQGKNVNIYIPNKPDVAKKQIMSDGRNTSIISKSFERLTSFENNNFTLKELNEKVNTLFNDICDYFDFDMAGVIQYRTIDDKYFNSITFGKDNVQGAEIEKDFVEELKKHCDNDGTLYFSSRKNVHKNIGRYLDRFGVESGHYYVFSSNDKPIGVVYFLKKSKSLFDTYIRESLLIFSFYISNYLYRIHALKVDTNRNAQFNDVLKITGCALYSVNNRDYSIMSYSPSLKQLLPDLKLGDKCYEVIAGKSKKCDKCPLRSGKKVVTTIKHNRYESSLALTTVGGIETHILLSPIKTNDYQVRERFDHDLLINSYYSFFESIKDSFMISERGYMLIMNIDNIDALVEALPSEKFNAYLRSFYNDIKKINDDKKEIYRLNNYSFGIILSNVNNNDVIDLAEKIYILSKKNYLNNSKIFLNLSYFVVPYPFGYQNPNDYTKFIKTNTSSRKELLNRDYIYVNESKYARSASHQKYILDILNTSISTHTFKVKIQPVLNMDKRIVSGELLFRIADANRGGELSTIEVINAAASEKKISIITNQLINYINLLYTNYEKTMFKKYGLKHISINVDYSFFEDDTFIDRLRIFKSEKKLEDDFLNFEISEKEIADHINDIAQVFANIQSTNSTLICDNYSGEYLSIDTLASLGIKGVKIPYKITSQIDKDEYKYEALTHISQSCQSKGMFVGVVGVESARQFAMLKDINVPFIMQGYYFYQPLDEQELLNALFKHQQ